MSQVLSFHCDECQEEFSVEEGMDLPPYWMGMQVCLGNQYGIIPEREMDVILHFCGINCLKKYINGENMKRRLALVDKDL